MDKRGLTIVEVLASFLVLMAAAGAFVLCLNTANSQLAYAENIRSQANEIARDYAGADYTDLAQLGEEIEYTFSFPYAASILPDVNVTVRGANIDGVRVFLPPSD